MQNCGSGTSSSSLSPYAGGDLQNNQKYNRQLILIFLYFWSKSGHIFLFSRSVPSLPLGLIFLLSMVDLAVAVFCGRYWVIDDGWICGVQRAVIVRSASSVGGRRVAVGFCGGQPAGKRERRRRRRDTRKRRSSRGLSMAAGRLRKERLVWVSGRRGRSYVQGEGNGQRGEEKMVSGGLFCVDEREMGQCVGLLW
jgi:hypothetical protein